jgi:hypothetical protein
VPYTLKKRRRIVAALNKRYLLRSHKFGVELPKSVQDALRTDEQSITKYWKVAKSLEIKNIDLEIQDLKVNKKYRLVIILSSVT